MPSLPPPDLSLFRVSLEIPVWWGDQDAFLHVNNTIYLRWFESARIEYANRIGLSRMMRENRVGPILASVSCDFRRQLRYPDTVTSHVRVSRIGRSSLTMEHAIVGKSNGEVAASGTSTLVVFDYNADQPIRVPEEIRRAINELEGRDVSQERPRPS